MRLILIFFFFTTGIWAQNDDARITEVDFRGKYQSDEYTVNITISSPDTGCNQYADWWEVVTTEGKLIYRRILAHSHVTEQPFTRGASGVELKRDQEVYIRVHMNNTGYSNLGYSGSIANTFTASEIPENFALDLAKVKPLPKGCAF